jgi:hypothetical protein
MNKNSKTDLNLIVFEDQRDTKPLEVLAERGSQNRQLSARDQSPRRELLPKAVS